MITAVVRIRLPEGLELAAAKDIFKSTAVQYQAMPGLVRKYYLLSEDGRSVGGVYLWESREQALAQYTDEWKAFVEGKYGTPPSVELFETPVVVDNLLNRMVVS